MIQILWNFEIQTDHQIPARRSDLMLIKRIKMKSLQTEVLMTASVLRSPGLFTVFELILTYCSVEGLDYPSDVLFPSFFTKSLMTVPSAPTTIGITDNFMFHSFLCSLARSMYLSIFLFSIGNSLEKQNPLADKFFVLINIRSGQRV